MKGEITMRTALRVTMEIMIAILIVWTYYRYGYVVAIQRGIIYLAGYALGYIYGFDPIYIAINKIATLLKK